MKLIIKHQESYSRGELLLRTFFGWIYITLPHMFLLAFVGIWSSILAFVTWWIILFTGEYPKSMFEFQVAYLNWSNRVYARMFNLSDGYPSFGISGTDDLTSLDIPYPEKLSRGMLLVKTFFGIFYVMIPHGFVLYFRLLWNMILLFLAWWVVLFTGTFPKSWHEFTVGTLRWSMRINMYMGLWMTDEYPPFTGKELDSEKGKTDETVVETTE
jgi:hypothetical protein